MTTKKSTLIFKALSYGNNISSISSLSILLLTINTFPYSGHIEPFAKIVGNFWRATCFSKNVPLQMLDTVLRLYASGFQMDPKLHLLEAVVRRCSRKFRNSHKKTSVLQSLFNKVEGLKACNFIKKKLQRRCFPVKFAKFLCAPFFREHLRWLLLTF